MKHTIIKTLFSLLLTVVPITAIAAPQNLDELKQAVATILTETNAPAFGIALVDKNGPVWVEGLGEARRETHTPATKDTLFRIGSVSKMFAGVAIMQLVDEGKLSLDDKLRNLAPALEFENPWAASHPVLIAHLLEHTTGWDVHPGEYSIPAPDSLSLADGLNSHPDSRVSRWAPGTRHTYSNTGPVVAALVVENVTGLRFEDYVQQHIFAPLKMNSSSFFKTEAYNKRGATLYTPKGPADYLHIYSRPSSSLNTSANDMAQFLAMFIGRGEINSGTNKATRVLSEAAVTRMENSTTTLGAQSGMHSGYGITMDVSGFDNLHTAFYGHSGGLPGAVTEFIYQPELEAGFVFMINEVNHQAFVRLSKTFKNYLLKDQNKHQVTARPLPEKFQKISGLYTPINPIFELGRIQFDITHVMRFSSDDKFFHRSPLFGGWMSNDYATSDDVLVSEWSGLPSIAIVNDPVAGEAIQVEGVLYQKTSAILVYGRLAVLAISSLLIISGLLYPLVWLAIKLFKKSQKKVNSNIRFLPFLLSVLLILPPLALMMSGIDPKLMMESVFIGVSLFIFSIAYPVCSIAGLLVMIKNKTRDIRKITYRYCTAVVMAHVIISVYLVSYGLFAYRIWA